MMNRIAWCLTVSPVYFPFFLLGFVLEVAIQGFITGRQTVGVMQGLVTIEE